ncbi:hypothetical protein EJ04DRAFT_502934 [Polyplosphaeria fusca]|uniref:Uncharacterized protein n=1 Tax=Polyplosphaeria fusca TaxID=682080 RepID=A0A9P4UWA2_9PLEO|nr:hypothetical protein EJ04DRAFT_502934 [Polyplosphaeria fusca]
MVAQAIPPPNARDLLPPLLACLSTATASRSPPSGLLTLVSPILRQRLQLLASEDWLSLLTWDRQVALKLPQIVSAIQVEPHPVSGEVEVEDPDQISYRRSDPETLHSRLVLGEFGIIPVYLWCTGGDDGNRWKLSELRGLEHDDDGTEWFPTMTEANDAGFRRKRTSTNGSLPPPTTTVTSAPETAKQGEDDDDAYWAAYDRTPSGTPKKPSPAPMAPSRVQLPSQSELEYFARYAAEVQPAMDAHDPDEAALPPTESTLNGATLDHLHRAPQTEPHASNLGPNGFDSSLPPAPNGTHGDVATTSHTDTAAAAVVVDEDDRYAALNHPRPSSAASTSSVERLEREAESSSQAERAIKQHISTDLKSLFRLARTAGIERGEFERIIMRELEVLPLLEQDD